MKPLPFFIALGLLVWLAAACSGTKDDAVATDASVVEAAETWVDAAANIEGG